MPPTTDGSANCEIRWDPVGISLWTANRRGAPPQGSRWRVVSKDRGARREDPLRAAVYGGALQTGGDGRVQVVGERLPVAEVVRRVHVLVGVALLGETRVVVVVLVEVVEDAVVVGVDLDVVTDPVAVVVGVGRVGDAVTVVVGVDVVGHAV